VKQRTGMEVSFAAAEAVKQCNIDVIAAYPITPQTHIVERLAEYVADGELDAEFVPVESEHSALSLCIGSQAVGARSFTCTSSQGLALMSELLYITSGLRLPLVMVLVNRSLSAPLSIWNDHSDVMSVRDCGWIQFFVKNGQELYDHLFIAYRLAENPDVLIPVIINVDGFILSHVFEPLETIRPDEAQEYLPPYTPRFVLHPDNPVTMGAFAMPSLFTEAKKAHDEALKRSYGPILETLASWSQLSGRRYHPVETLYTEDAETLFIVMGSFAETLAEAVKTMRDQGRKAGLVVLRLWRPFPFKDFRRAVAGAKKLIIIDRALSPGGPGGPLAAEIRSALYNIENRPQVYDYIAGLGGRDVTIEDYVQMHDASMVHPSGYEIYGLQGDETTSA
jgi:pyruvate ferredoxin oxidoreductase alpha subunit